MIHLSFSSLALVAFVLVVPKTTSNSNVADNDRYSRRTSSYLRQPLCTAGVDHSSNNLFLLKVHRPPKVYSLFVVLASRLLSFGIRLDNSISMFAAFFIPSWMGCFAPLCFELELPIVNFNVGFYQMIASKSSDGTRYPKCGIRVYMTHTLLGAKAV